MDNYFEFYNPVKICSGKNALSNLPNELEALNVSKPIIITDKGVEGAGLLDYVINSFKESVIAPSVIFNEVPPDSGKDTVNKCAKIYRENDCDSIIAVGGGSVIDTAKGVNILVSENGDDLMDFCGANILTKPLNPFIVVPTTSGTGSEVTLVAVIADKEKNIKMLFLSPFLLPNVAIIDPKTTLTLPPRVTAATGIDALTHAIESYICVGKNLLSDAYAVSAIKLISENLINTIKNPKDEGGRLALANASTMAGIAFSNSMVGLVHTIGHSLGSVCHIPHGVAMNIFLPSVLEYNMDKSEKYIAELLLPLAGSEIYSTTPKEKRAQKVIEFISDMRDTIFDLTELPRRLSETGRVTEENFEEIAKIAMGDASATYNPKEADFDDIMRIIKKAW